MARSGHEPDIGDLACRDWAIAAGGVGPGLTTGQSAFGMVGDTTCNYADTKVGGGLWPERFGGGALRKLEPSPAEF